MLTVYNFEIFYWFNRINSTNKSSKRFDYKKISLLNIRLLLMLQNKLTLLFINKFCNEFSITQNKRKNSNFLIFELILVFTLTETVIEKTFFVNIKKQILNNFILMFRLVDIAIVISRKNVKTMLKDSYNESQKSIKFLI